MAVLPPKLLASSSASAFADSRLRRSALGGSPSGYSIGGSDRFEREAERNETRIRSMLASGPRSRVGPLEASADPPSSIRRSPLTARPSSAASPTGTSATGGGEVSIGTLRLIFKDAAVSGGAGEIRRSPLDGDFVLARAKGGTVALGAGMQRSSGSGLPVRVRRLLEPAFGRSFDDVRVHTDAGATMATAAVHAEAFTIGRDIYFNRGFYDPASARGIALIGHELTHVVQNKGGVRRKSFEDWYAQIDPEFAHELNVRRQGKTFAAEIDTAVSAYKKVGRVNFEDTQEHGEKFRSNAWSSGHFNSAEADPKTGFTGGAAVTQDLGQWLYEKQKKKERITQSELIFKALDLNKGNLPLAMGTIAGALADDRKRADNVDGLGNNIGKDYYRFAGAFVALQSVPLRVAGVIASKGDIATTEIVTMIDQRKSYSKASNSKRLQFDIGFDAISAIKRKALDVDGDDAAERQAVSNERAIYKALAAGGAPARLRATAAAPALRRKGLWESVTDLYGEAKQRRQDFFSDLAARGERKGGVLGNTQYWLAIMGGTLSDMVLDPVYVAKQLGAYTAGFGVGAYESVKGTVNMIVHPLQTAEGVWNLIVNWKQTGAAIGDKVKALMELASTDPQRFAFEVGKIAGEIDMSLIGPKAIGGTREVAGMIKSAKNLKMFGGDALWVYSKASTAKKIKSLSQVGSSTAASAWATPLDPLIGSSDSFLGRLATNLATGGDKVRVLDKAIGGAVTAREGWSVATKVGGGSFRPILMVPLAGEELWKRLMKSTGFQMAAKGPQSVKWLDAVSLSDPVKGLAKYHAADALAMTTSAAGTRAVAMGHSKREDSAGEFVDFYYQLATGIVNDVFGQSAQRKRRGSSRFADDDPEVARLFHEVVDRYGHEPGVSLDFSTKSKLERFLGRELGDVRIHTGPLAGEVARATEAEAITFGRDIYLPGEQLGGSRGLELLAHEATHVAQAGPATPLSSPRSLGVGGGAEAMENAARSVEARFRAFSRAPSYPALAEPVVRESPVAPAASAAAAPAAPASSLLEAATPSPVAAPQRRATGDVGEQTPGFDPVGEVMRTFHVPPSVSQEEFLDICTERLIELVKDELASDADRRESLAWNYDLPNV